MGGTVFWERLSKSLVKREGTNKDTPWKQGEEARSVYAGKKKEEERAPEMEQTNFPLRQEEREREEVKRAAVIKEDSNKNKVGTEKEISRLEINKLPGQQELSFLVLPQACYSSHTCSGR